MADLSKWKGLGGWLIPVGLGLCLSPINRFYVIFRDVTLLFGGGAGLPADSYTAVHFAGYTGFLIFEAVCEMVFLAVNIWLLFLFFKERRTFPRPYIFLLLASASFVLLKYGFLLHAFWTASGAFRNGLDDAMSDQEVNVFRAVLSAIFWGLYITKSKRVKATFVN